MRFERVDPRLLHANPWNTNVVSPDNQAKIEASLERHGWVKPVLARELEDGRMQILGGQHRVEAAISLGHEDVPVCILDDVDDQRAKEIGLIDNARYGADDAIALAELLQELGEPQEIASVLPYGDEELATLYGNIDVDLDTLDLEEPNEDEKPGKEKRAPKTHSMLRFKVPLEDLDDVSDLVERIKKEQGFTESDALTNAGDALVWLARQYLDLVRA